MRRNIALFLILAVAAMPAVATSQSTLGKVAFPVTGSNQAKALFLRGVAALHSFWYEEALEAFRESTRIEPDFVMGYWGEALAHTHPLWQEQDLAAARKVLEKLPSLDKITPRERAYVAAVRALYGEGDKPARDAAYAAAMEKVYRAYPDDLEAAAFYSLSILGTVRPGEKGFRRQMKAGAIALDVYEKNPDHPGAAHYIIHAFDDPEHAILALPAARRYAEIAPDAHHARHMPSHIFLQLGMWPEAASSNESSWGVSCAWVKAKKLPITRRDYHSLQWLTYIYLQQGRYSKARDLISQIESDIKESAEVKSRGYAPMTAAFVVETERWDLAKQFFEESKSSEPSSTYGSAQHAHDKAATAGPPRRQGAFIPTFIAGLAAANSGSGAQVEKSLSELGAARASLETDNPYRAKLVRIMELEIKASAAAQRKEYDSAIALMKQATEIEEDMSPPSGPPDVIKPSHELFGEILLAAWKAGEAREQFSIALQRQPNRARSLLGAARAAVRANDAAAALNFYTQLLSVWSHADAENPLIKEARSQVEELSRRASAESVRPRSK